MKTEAEKKAFKQKSTWLRLQYKLAAQQIKSLKEDKYTYINKGKDVVPYLQVTDPVLAEIKKGTRAIHLARAYFHGKPYKMVENVATYPVDVEMIAVFITSRPNGSSYITDAGFSAVMDQVQAWVKGE